MEKEDGFSNYLWNYLDGKPKQNGWNSLKQVPAETPVSQALSKDLRKRGFTFVGPTIVYAFMQAVGMVTDILFARYPHDIVTKPKSRSRRGQKMAPTRICSAQKNDVEETHTS